VGICGQAEYKLRVSPVNVYKVEGQLEMHRNVLRTYIIRNNLSVGDDIGDDKQVVFTARRTTTEPAAQDRMGSGTIPTCFACPKTRLDVPFNEEFDEDNTDCVGSINVTSGSRIITKKDFRLAFADVGTIGANNVMEFISTKSFQLFERCQGQPHQHPLITATLKSTTGNWGTGDFSFAEIEMPSSTDSTDLLRLFIVTILTFTARLRLKRLRYGPGNQNPWEFKVHLGSKFFCGLWATMKSYVNKGGYFLVDQRHHFMDLVYYRLFMTAWFPVY